MESNNLWVIIRAIHYGGEITPRQVRLMLACESKKACRLLEHLVAVGAGKTSASATTRSVSLSLAGRRASTLCRWCARIAIRLKFATRTGRAIRFTKLSGVV